MAGPSIRATVYFEIDQAIANMQALEAKARATGQTLGTAFNTSEAALHRYEQALTLVGRNMAIVGGGLTAFTGAAVNSAMNFEAQIDAVGAVSGATTEDLKALSEEALRVGAATTFSATEVGVAAEILAKAGIDIKNITGDYKNGVMGIAEGAVRLSEATGSDITLSAETAAAAMTVFNLTAADTEHVMNVIAQSANASMLSVEDWTYALQYAGPTAATLGYTIDELAQAMVILGNSGIRGSVAATSLRNIMSQLTDTGSPAVAMLSEYGIALQDAEGNMRGLDDITRDLVPTWNTLSDAEKNNFAIQAFGVRGGPAFLAMMNEQAEAVNNGGDAWVTAGKKMEATGDIHSMSAARMDNLKGSIERLRGSIETFMIRIGSALAPGIRFLADAINVVTDALGNLPDWAIAMIAFGVAGSGALLLVGGGFLMLLPQILMTTEAIARLGGMSGVLRLLIAPIRAVGLALMTSFWPITLITAAAAALYFAWKYNFLGLQDLVDGFVGWIKDAWEVVSDFVDFAKNIFDTGGGEKKELGVDVKTTTDENFDKAVDFVEAGSHAAEIALTTKADDMFIEYVYGADGTVIGYTVKITSSTDGTVQTGKILSSSRDPNNPDQIHMEVQLESGETVEGTYSEITGKFTAIPGSVDVAVSASFLGDAYVVTQRELPDGTMGWVITEAANPETGETFGEVIQSYTDQTGTTYILVDPDPSSTGDEFWAKVDLATGTPTPIVGIDGDPSKYDGKLTSILSATGDLLPVVVVNIDGNDVPYGNVLSGIMDPATGNKLITLKVGNGQTFLLEVDGVTGQIIDSHEITVTADTVDAQTNLDALVDTLTWIGTFDGGSGIWGFIARMAEGFERLIFLAKNFKTVLDDLTGRAEEGGGRLVELTKIGGRLIKLGLEKTGIFEPSPYEPRGDGAYEDTKMPGTVIEPVPEAGDQDPHPKSPVGQGVIAGLLAYRDLVDDIDQMLPPATMWVSDFNSALGASGPAAGSAAPGVESLARSIESTDAAAQMGAGNIETSSGRIGGAFSLMAGSVLGQSMAAALAGQTNFGLLRDAVVGRSMEAATGAQASIGGMATGMSAQFTGIQNDATTKMGGLGGVVASRTQAAASAGVLAIQGLATGVSNQFTGLTTAASSRMASLQSVISSKASEAKSAAVTSFTDMGVSVGAQLLGMQLAAQLKMALMAQQATTQGEAVRSNLVTKLETANSQASTTLGRLSGIVSGAGALAAISAYFAGQNISSSFASGMESMLGRIQAAASAMVAAAMMAVLAKAMISSPSKVFMEYGEYMGEGMEIGLLNKRMDVARAADRLVPIPELTGGLGAIPAYANTAAGAISYTTYNQAYVLTSDEWVAAQDKIARAQQQSEILSNTNGYTQYGRRRR